MGEKSKERTAKAFGTLTPLLGLGAQVAAAAPAFRKAPQVKGEIPANYGAALGIAAQGHGMGRGPATLQAYRQVSQTEGQVAQARAKANYFASNINAQNEIARRERIAKGGADLAAGMGVLAAGLVENANARKAEREAALGQPTRPGGIEAQSPERNVNMALDAMQGQRDMLSPEEVLQNPDAVQSDLLTPLMEQVKLMTEKEIRNKSEALAQSRASLGIPAPELALQIAPEMQEQASRFNILMDLIDKEGLDMQLALPQLVRSAGMNVMQFLNPPIRLMQEDLDFMGSGE